MNQAMQGLFAVLDREVIHWPVVRAYVLSRIASEYPNELLAYADRLRTPVYARNG